MVGIVFLIPLLTGVLAFFLPRTSGRPLLVLTGVLHLILSLYLWFRRPEALFEVYFAVTPEGLLSLLVISLLFLGYRSTPRNILRKLSCAPNGCLPDRCCCFYPP